MAGPRTESNGVTTFFDWDFDDYLTKITQGATVVEFKYDGLKRRVQRIAGGTTRDFLYSGDQITVEQESGSNAVEYFLARAMIFRAAGGVKETYHFDWIGSARALTNAAQTVLATWNYEAFGSVVGSTGSSGNAYKFDGKWRYRDDGDFGLLHVGARYYEPGTGRFIASDEWLGKTDQPQTINRYAFVINSPANAIDPTGKLILWVIVVGVIVGGAIGYALGGGAAGLPGSGVTAGAGRSRRRVRRGDRDDSL